MYYRHSPIILFLICLLSACSIFSPVKVDAPKQYVLEKTPVVKRHTYKHHILFIAPMVVDPLYDTSDMAYSVSPYQIHYFVKSKWAKNPKDMLQPLIVKTLLNTHAFRNVTMNASENAMYVLNTELVTLKQLFVGERSHYKITLRAELLSAHNMRLIATKEFSKTVHVNNNNAYSGVIAANIAIEQILKELATFCVQHGR
jgi:cholesterol transport system auxiliary component